MKALLERPDRLGLVANVGVALCVVVAINLLIFALGWGTASAHTPAFVPAPTVIAVVWVALFACMALARWEINRSPPAYSARAVLDVLFALCAAYPLYTGGLRSETVGAAADAVLLGLTVWLGARYARRAPRAGAWLVPLALWLTFATIAGTYEVMHPA